MMNRYVLRKDGSKRERTMSSLESWSSRSTRCVSLWPSRLACGGLPVCCCCFGHRAFVAADCQSSNNRWLFAVALAALSLLTSLAETCELKGRSVLPRSLNLLASASFGKFSSRGRAGRRHTSRANSFVYKIENSGRPESSYLLYSTFIAPAARDELYLDSCLLPERLRNERHSSEHQVSRCGADQRASDMARVEWVD